MRLNSRRQFSDLLLLAILAALFVDVIGLSYTRPTQTFSADSVYYMELVRNLADGRGFIAGERFFASWPAGYPILVLVVHQLLGIEPFWASKTVNFLALGVTLWAFRAVFADRAPLYGAVLLIAQVLGLAMMSLSETTFVSLLILFSLALYTYERCRKPIFVFLILATSVALFLCRYIGLVSLVPVAVIGLRHLLVGDRRSFWCYLGIGMATLAIAAAYLFNNLYHAGHSTGQIRLLYLNDLWSYVQSVFTTLIFQVNVVRLRFGSESVWQQSLWALSAVFLLAAAAHLAWTRRAADADPPPAGSAWERPWPYFLLVGGAYLSAIVAIRWIFAFGDDPDRLFAPAVPLLLLAAIDALDRRTGVARILRRYILIGALASVTFNVAGKLAMDVAINRPNLPEYRAVHEALPQGTAIVFSDSLIRYLRPDIVLIDHRRAPVAKGPEAVVEYACALGATSVFTENRTYIAENGYHPAFSALIQRHPQGRPIKLGECPAS
jgi:hypothetical protein